VPRRTTFRFGGERAGRWDITDRPVLTAVAAQPTELPARVTDLAGQLGRCLRELHALQHELDSHIEHCRRAGLAADESIVGRLADATRQAKWEVAGQQQILLGDAEPTATERLAAVEPVLRYGTATLAYVRGTLASCSPSPTGPDAASYDAVEQQLLDVFDLVPEEHAVSVTASGMAAYTLVEAFLLRERLRPGDTVLRTRHLDARIGAQLDSLPFVNVVQVDGHSAEDLIAAVRQHRPRCLFADPVADTAGQRMTDIPRLLDLLPAAVTELTTVVIDGTLVSGALPDLLPAADDRVEVLYYERSSALQLGIDAGVGGVVVCPAPLRPTFDQQRHNAGLAPHRTGVELFPQYDRDSYLGRMYRTGANALRLARLLHDDPHVRAVGSVYHPGMPSHPDHEIAGRLPFPGGRVTFTYHYPDLGTAELEGLAERAGGRARQDGVDPATILSTTDGAPPFLSLRVGDRDDHVDIVAAALSGALG
jgi:cystathionine gamma-synthase